MLNLVLATQYLDQLEADIQKSILGNVGTLMAFRLGSPDALTLEPEFAPEFRALDLEHRGAYQMAIRLAVDNITSRPFSAVTLNPRYLFRRGRREKIIAHSRQRYGVPRTVVEDKIARWLRAERPLNSP